MKTHMIKMMMFLLLLLMLHLSSISLKL